MFLIPDFELGLWNAWILVLSFFLLFIGWQILNRLREQKGSRRPNKPPFKDNEQNLYNLSQLIFGASVIYSFFLPLKLGTAWFYLGVFVFLFGMIFTIVAGINLEKTPIDKPATEGLYRISRNPLYLGTFLIFIGIGIACASWLYLLLIALFIVLYDFLIAAEERWCLKKYGVPYREYVNQIPRWIGIRHQRNESEI